MSEGIALIDGLIMAVGDLRKRVSLGPCQQTEKEHSVTKGKDLQFSVNPYLVRYP